MAQALPAEGVLTATIEAAGGKRIGRATLHAPGTLNSLTTAMVEQLLQCLQQWESDDRIACIVIDGSGEKAFCAGGDVQMLRQSSLQNPGGPCCEAEAFFASEYRMNYALHSCKKPVLVWGDGIVMGGGLGILAGGSHRVVTETSRFAMPEITIALFPDVGGSFFLNLMPGKTGRFLALTGASFNATDALYTGLADYFVARDAFDTLLEVLGNTAELNAGNIANLLQDLAAQSTVSMPEGNIERHREIMDQFCAAERLHEVYAAITQWQGDDKWLAKARDGLAQGSPLAALWIDGQLQRSVGVPLADVFRSELVLATNIVRHSEFAEGVRALLVDKDRKPQWQYTSIDDVPGNLIDSFFEPPWPENPLADL
ncbi:MAG: enoyl-CoA hydratase/isomerase family protein [Pseudomonadales bacterium]